MIKQDDTRVAKADCQAQQTRTSNEEVPYAATALPDQELPAPTLRLTTRNGRVYCGDSLQLLSDQTIVQPGTVNLIMTSPPFGLVRKKEYGNVDADLYVEWFRPFAEAFHRVLAENGSLVIDIGGAWMPGQPTRSLYHYELLIMLCREYGFHLAQEFFWWNPSKLPTPAEWVNVRRVRVKDAVNCVWWLSKTPWPKASNRRVLQPYSDAMLDLLKNGYKDKLRPSGHDISKKFKINNGASIPPNILAIPNTESNSAYLRYCLEHDLKVHPARFPAALPEFFIRMVTDPGDLVIDPFAGSCVTGEVAWSLDRNWICCELREDYVDGATGRFVVDEEPTPRGERFYKLARPGLLWDGVNGAPLALDGGKKRPPKSEHKGQNGCNGEVAREWVGAATATEDAAGEETPQSKASRKPKARRRANHQSQEVRDDAASPQTKTATQHDLW